MVHAHLICVPQLMSGGQALAAQIGGYLRTRRGTAQVTRRDLIAAQLRRPRPPSTSSAFPCCGKRAPVCWTVEDQVVTANEPWFGSVAIEQALRERRDNPSGGA